LFGAVGAKAAFHALLRLTLCTTAAGSHIRGWLQQLAALLCRLLVAAAAPPRAGTHEQHLLVLAAKGLSLLHGRCHSVMGCSLGSWAALALKEPTHPVDAAWLLLLLLSGSNRGMHKT
jgi:hypothetical protein